MARSIDELHLAKGALSDRVYVGFLNSDKSVFTKKKDVTGEFMRAIVERHAGYIESFYLNGKKYTIEVKEVEE
jgi:hypothetical protein